jgi:FKBP-type peptidyl-prolyl cis-trans isomerase
MSISEIGKMLVLVASFSVSLVAGCDATFLPGRAPSAGSTGATTDNSSPDNASSSDDGTGPQDSTEAPALTTLNNRTLQVGDSWTYEERQETSMYGETSTTVGTHVYEVLPDTATDFAGNAVGMMRATFSGIADGETSVVRSVWWYFSQDEEGTIYYHGRVNGYVNPPAERFVQWPPEGKYATIGTPFSVGATNTWDVFFNDGARSAGQSSIVAIETVIVPAGTFVAAKVEVANTESSELFTYTWNSTLWHVPEIGRDVKAELRFSVDDQTGGLAATGRRVRELTETTLSESEETTEEPAEEPGPPPLPEGAVPVTTDSGLQYYDFQVGTGQQPLTTSTVTIDYVGYLEDGTVFDSGDAVQLSLSNVVDGFAEGVATMREGGQRRLIIPPELGYGSEGYPQAGIGGEDTIIFDVTLLSVDEPDEEADGGGSEPGIPPLPEGAELITSASGLQYYDFEVGTGQQPLITSVVTVDYVGYREDGTVFDSGEAVQLDLGEAIEGLFLGLNTMQEGGRRRLIIPPELGYGPEGNPDVGVGGDETITYDVTLIRVDEL